YSSSSFVCREWRTGHPVRHSLFVWTTFLSFRTSIDIVAGVACILESAGLLSQNSSFTFRGQCAWESVYGVLEETLWIQTARWRGTGSIVPFGRLRADRSAGLL